MSNRFAEILGAVTCVSVTLACLKYVGVLNMLAVLLGALVLG
jgi:hypothetical protein